MRWYVWCTSRRNTPIYKQTPKNSELMVYITAHITAEPDNCITYAVMYPIDNVETSNGILFNRCRANTQCAHKMVIGN